MDGHLTDACCHEATEPVVSDIGIGEAQDHGRLCMGCGILVPSNWHCTDCEWYEFRTLCASVPDRILAVPCKKHGGRMST